jgi:hypothetical protein
VFILNHVQKRTVLLESNFGLLDSEASRAAFSARFTTLAAEASRLWALRLFISFDKISLRKDNF